MQMAAAAAVVHGRRVMASFARLSLGQRGRLFSHLLLLPRISRLFTITRILFSRSFIIGSSQQQQDGLTLCRI